MARSPDVSRNQVTVRRLTSDDAEIARALFQMLAEVFGEEPVELGTEATAELLSRSHYWVLAAIQDGRVIGGVTAHTLPMTSSTGSEILLYDIAVREEHQRTGIGRRLVKALQDAGSQAGITQLWVLADNEDRHALEFYRALGGSSAAVTMFTFP